MYKYAMTQWIVGNEDMEVSFQRLKENGYDAIEFAADPYNLDVDRCLALMDQYGMKCYSLCGMFSEERDLTASGETAETAIQYLKDSVDFACKVGAGVIIVVPSPVGRTVPPEGLSMDVLYGNAVKNVRIAADYAQKKGVKFAIEAINRYETFFMNTLTKAYQFVKDIDHPAVGIMADTFHMSIEENSFIKSLHMISDKLIHVHIADNTREPCGLGTINFKEIMYTLHDINYSGICAMEFMYRLANPYSSLDMNTQGKLMDVYAKQAIDHIRMIERAAEQTENLL